MGCLRDARLAAGTPHPNSHPGVKLRPGGRPRHGDLASETRAAVSSLVSGSGLKESAPTFRKSPEAGVISGSDLNRERDRPQPRPPWRRPSATAAPRALRPAGPRGAPRLSAPLQTPERAPEGPRGGRVQASVRLGPGEPGSTRPSQRCRLVPLPPERAPSGRGQASSRPPGSLIGSRTAPPRTGPAPNRGGASGLAPKSRN